MGKEECLRGVKLFETLDDESITKLTDAVVEEPYAVGEEIIRQGEEGQTLFVLLAGECIATVETGTGVVEDVQEVKRYTTGEAFGELALLGSGKRRATVKALVPSKVLTLS